MPDVVITAPTIEPVSVSDVKCEIGIEDVHDHDTRIQSYVTLVREHVEQKYWTALITQTREVTFDYFPSCFVMPRAPLQSVTSITYLDLNGASQTLATSQYDVNLKTKPGEITPADGVTWPSTQVIPNAVTVRYVAGYGSTASDVPLTVREAIIAGADHRFRGCDPVAIVAAIMRGTDYDYSMDRRPAAFA